jgi:hypothetical protein
MAAVQITIEPRDITRVAALISTAAAAIEGEARIANGEGNLDRMRRLWSEADRLYAIAEQLIEAGQFIGERAA